jgi:Gpi18-like mannosyltransferase/predicted membrane-bound dolichyl-phosphate-mannose-protein mannosyltransferase
MVLPGLLLLAAFVARVLAVICFDYRFEWDVQTFQAWSWQLYEHGLSAFYIQDSFTDYPPMYMYVLYVVGMLRDWFDWPFLSLSYNLAVFMPPIICDVAIGALLYHLTRRQGFARLFCALISAAWLFNPAVILNSSVWGQVDSVFTLVLFVSIVYLTRQKMLTSFLLFGAAILIKPQSLFLGPVYLYYTYDYLQKQAFKPQAILEVSAKLVLAVLFMIALVLPFTQRFDLSPILNEYLKTLESYPYASVNAYNFYTLVGGNWRALADTHLGIAYSVWGMWAIILIVAGSLYLLHYDKEKKHTYLIAGALVVFVFMFSVKMHERYVYPALLFILMAYVQNRDKRVLALFFGFTATTFANCFDVLYKYKNHINMLTTDMTVSLTALANMLLTLYLLYVIYTSLFPIKEAYALTGQPPAMKRKDYALIMGLTVVYAFIAFFRLGDAQAPQSAWTPAPGEVAAVDLGVVADVQYIRFMMGARHDTPFMVYGSEDNHSWHFSYENHSANVFAWAQIPVHTRARYFQIIPYGEPGLRIQEMAFFDFEDKPLPIAAYTPQAAALFDEPHLVPDAPGFMNSTYFDEIYHARTGYEFANRLPVYEYTHPPLGKNMIALSIKTLGMTPFAWRLPGTLLGVLMLPLIYAMARQLFNSNNWALFAAVVFAFDFMHFAQTRIATIDTYVVFFVMAMYLFMLLYIKRGGTGFLCLCGLCMGLAIAAKWQGVYGALGLPLLFFPVWYASFKQNKREAVKTLAGCFAWFVFIPLLVYALSYIPFVLASGGGGLRTILENQRGMLTYHADVVGTHPFSSHWWEWPFNTRPMWMYVNYVSDGVRQGISSFGNPAVWWMGVAAVVYALASLFKKKDAVPLFLLMAYAAQYLPWVLVSRETYIYHYFPSVPFMVLMIVYFFKSLSANNTKWAVAYGSLVFALFALFYPILSGAVVSVSFVEAFLRWLPGWYFV